LTTSPQLCQKSTASRAPANQATSSRIAGRHHLGISGRLRRNLQPGADALFTAEVRSFPGRLGIMHRDLPEMVARSYADVAFTWHHLVSYWARIFPNQFEAVAVPGAEPFFTEIALARAIDPPRMRALQAFDEFFFIHAKDVYPRYEFATMKNDEFGKTLLLG
jgi:hypothetical protein